MVPPAGGSRRSSLRILGARAPFGRMASRAPVPSARVSTRPAGSSSQRDPRRLATDGPDGDPGALAGWGSGAAALAPAPSPPPGSPSSDVIAALLTASGRGDRLSSGVRVASARGAPYRPVASALGASAATSSKSPFVAAKRRMRRSFAATPLSLQSEDQAPPAKRPPGREDQRPQRRGTPTDAGTRKAPAAPGLARRAPLVGPDEEEIGHRPERNRRRAVVQPGPDR